MVKFVLRGNSSGVPIRTPRNEDLEILPVYEIISPLFLYQSRKVHAENGLATQHGSNISREQQVIIDREDRCEG